MVTFIFDIQIDQDMLERLGEQYNSRLPEFMKSIGLGHVEDADGKSIIYEDGELEFMGISEAVQQLRFRVLFQRELLNTTPAIAILFPVDKVCEFFKTFKNSSISKCASEIKEKGIDGEMLYLADNKVLCELGIPSVGFRHVKNRFESEVKEALDNIDKVE